MEIKLLVTIEEINVILEGLSHLPYRQVNGTFDKIKTQAQEQLKEQEKKEEN